MRLWSAVIADKPGDKLPLSFQMGHKYLNILSDDVERSCHELPVADTHGPTLLLLSQMDHEVLDTREYLLRGRRRRRTEDYLY